MAAGLSDFIAANNARIVDECEAFARTLGPAAEDMDRAALRDHIDQILVAVAADMKLPGGSIDNFLTGSAPCAAE